MRCGFFSSCSVDLLVRAGRVGDVEPALLVEVGDDRPIGARSAPAASSMVNPTGSVNVWPLSLTWCDCAARPCGKDEKESNRKSKHGGLQRDCASITTRPGAARTSGRFRASYGDRRALRPAATLPPRHPRRASAHGKAAEPMGSQPAEPSATDAQPAPSPAAELDPTAHPEPDHGMPAGPYAEPIGAVEAAGAGEAESRSARAARAAQSPARDTRRLEGTPQARAAAHRQPELHDGAGVRRHRAPVVARPARNGRVVPRDHVVLAVLRRPAGHRRLHLHVRRPVHRGEPPAPRRPGGVAGDSLRGRRGLLFLVVVPLAPWLIALGGHTPEMQRLETIYLQCLAFAALPMLVMAAVNGFFSGRGQTWTVLGIEASARR